MQLKKVLALFVSLCLCMTFLPAVVFADGEVASIGGVGYASLTEAIAAVQAGDTITIVADFTVDESKTAAEDRIVVDKAVTIDFGTHTMSVPGSLELTSNWSALFIDANVTLTGTTGGINCLDKANGEVGVYAINVRSNATLTIEGGCYHGGGTIIQAQLGNVIINGGTFSATAFEDPYGMDFALNCVDSNYQAGNAGFTINGGTFIGFDPQDNKSEGEHTDYTADDYVAIDDGTGTFTVQEGYVVTFNLNGGVYDASDANVEVRVEKGSTVAALVPDPTKTGVYFAGWYSDAACEIAYDFTSPVTAALTLYAKWEDSSVFCTVSLSLKDSIDINIYVKGVPTAYKNDYAVGYRFVGESEWTYTNLSSIDAFGTSGDTSIFKFTVASCAAREMTKEVELMVYHKDSEILRVTQSIRKYCTTVLNGSYSDKLKELCQSVLDYGSYAQMLFDQTSESSDELANYGYIRSAGDIIKSPNWSDADALALYASESYRSVPTAAWINKITCSLLLESQTEMSFYVYKNPNDSADLEVTVKVGDGNWTNFTCEKMVNIHQPNGGDVWRVVVKGIPAASLGDIITLTLSDSAYLDTVTMKYSPMTYAAKVGGTDNGTGWVCRALYRYYKAAAELFAD